AALFALSFAGHEGDAASVSWGGTMNLGYLMIPRQCSGDAPTRDFGRLELARDLGFSEFYAVKQADQATGSYGLNATPEHADALRTLPELPGAPVPQIVSINGDRQSLGETPSPLNLARPSLTPEQVAINARARQTTLSVSWLNKTELARHWAAHVSGSTHAGLRARPESWRVARTIVVCADAARAEYAVKSEDSPCRAYYAKMAAPGADRVTVDALIDDCVLYGTLQSVLDQLQDISTASGPFGTLTLVDHAWPDSELATESLVALASAIAPVMRRNCVAN
ncbi:hypothetical protein, partial [Roseobacter sp.]|uniref:hypothetical protein n=1 Tax=Roseobacter sp. TaxID=1907202 RepID=UPI0032991454